MSLPADETFSYYMNRYASDTRMIDTVLKINDIDNIINVIGTVLLDNVATNETYSNLSTIAFLSVSGCEFGNTEIFSLPNSITVGAYDEVEFIYRDLLINIAGKGATYWESLGYSEGMLKFTRLGIGAFIFPLAGYYVDFSRLSTGNGSASRPWNMAQMDNYVSHNFTATTNIVNQYVADGDIVHIKGVGTPFGYNLFQPAATFSGTVTFKAWDLKAYGMYVFDTTNSSSDYYTIIKHTSTNSNVIVKDLCVIANDTSNAVLIPVGPISDPGVYSSIFKNCMFFSYKANISIIMDEDPVLRFYGCNILSLSSTVFALDGKDVDFFDCAIKSGITIGDVGTITMHKCEISIAEGDIDNTFGATLVFNSCLFESSAADMLPETVTALTFNKSMFLYSDYGFTVSGGGSIFWASNDFANGMYGENRAGIGMFYFYSVSPILQKTYHPIPTTECHEPDIQPRTFWDYISTFWNYLKQSDRNTIEGFWHGLWIVGSNLIKKATRLDEVAAPEGARTCVFDDYYEIKLGALNAIPLYPDPTEKGGSASIVPITQVLVGPSYNSDQEVSYNDLISITARDYYRFRDIGIGCYVVVKVKNDAIVDRFFKVKNMLSSEEDAGSDRYYLPATRSSTNTTSGLYMIELDNGNLEYIGNNSFSIHFTTGLAYSVGKEVLQVPNLQMSISGDSVDFEVNDDYTFINGIIEFNYDIFSNGVSHDQIAYCKKAPIIENFLYESYGEVTGVSDWKRFNHTPLSGKAAINAAIKSLQNTSNLDDYNRLMNVLYGLPVSPDDGEVVGVYESYGYEVINVSGSSVTVKLKDGFALSGLIQDGGGFWIDGKPSVQVSSIANRESGIITLFDASSVSIGDLMYLHLPNALAISSVEPSGGPGNPGSITVSASDHPDMFNHLTDMVQLLSNESGYPEVVVYGTNGSQGYGCDGTYHITDAETVGAGIVKFNIYNPSDDSEPLYNDFINDSVQTDQVNRGYLHIEWPTHKFILIYLKNIGRYYKAYLDAPIDTVLKRNDKVEKYQVLCRCVGAVKSDVFPAWNQFNVFKRFNGIDEDVCLVEGTYIIPYSQFGQYLPSSADIVEVEDDVIVDDDDEIVVDNNDIIETGDADILIIESGDQEDLIIED
jgi:hypothetical protein